MGVGLFTQVTSDRVKGNGLHIRKKFSPERLSRIGPGCPGKSPSPEVFKRCVDITLRNMIQWWTWKCQVDSMMLKVDLMLKVFSNRNDSVILTTTAKLVLESQQLPLGSSEVVVNVCCIYYQIIQEYQCVLGFSECEPPAKRLQKHSSPFFLEDCIISKHHTVFSGLSHNLFTIQISTLARLRNQ